MEMPEALKSFDPNTIMMAVALAGAFLVVKFVVPRMMSGGAVFVDAATLRQFLDNDPDTVVVDVRSSGEFAGGHVPGAVNVPLPELPGRLRNAPADMEQMKNAPIFVMCHAANRSPGGARLLKKAGFTRVHVLKGGMSGWKRANMPVE